MNCIQTTSNAVNEIPENNSSNFFIILVLFILLAIIISAIYAY